MTLKRYFFSAFLVIHSLFVFGQKLDHANNLYRQRMYAVAIPEYESFLKKKADPIAKSRLADCYRILNQAEKAATLYSQMIADSTAKDKDIFNYADVMMMLGKYDSAQFYFKQYIDLNPKDERGEQSLKASIDAPSIKPYFTNITTSPFLQNSDADDNAPVFFKNKLIFATDRKQGFNALKQKNQTTGREYITLWASDKISDTVYSKPSSFSAKLNNVNENTGNVSFTADGKEMFFCRNSNIPDKSGDYNMQIFSGESKDGEKWHNIEKLPFCSSELNYFYPSVSPDGKHLFFVSDKGGGRGGLDIFVSNRTKKGWSKPENLGDNVNTTAHEGFPYATANGELFFCSKGHIGFGGFDIYVTHQDTATGEWVKPTNVGMPINSAFDDISITFKDSLNGAFSSPRTGHGDDIFFFTLHPDSLIQKQAGITPNNEITADEEDENAKYVKDSGTISISQAYLDTLANSLNKKKTIRKGKIFVLNGIAFDSVSLNISPQTKEHLDKLAGIMSLHRDIVFEIGVHTEGGSAIEKEVTQKQADALLEYLTVKGINSKRILAKGYGGVREFTEKQIVLKIKELN